MLTPDSSPGDATELQFDGKSTARSRHGETMRTQVPHSDANHLPPRVDTRQCSRWGKNPSLNP
jgi:hypothetical protein